MLKLLAWLSFVLALVAGAGLAANNAELVRFVIVLAALTAVVVDFAKDREPNVAAVVVAVALPSYMVGMDTGLTDALGRGLDSFWGWSLGWSGWLAGTESTLVIGFGAVVVSILIAKATMRGSATLSLRGGR